MRRSIWISVIVAAVLIGTLALTQPIGLQAAPWVPAHSPRSLISSQPPVSVTLSTCANTDCLDGSELNRANGGMTYVYLPLVIQSSGVAPTVPLTPTGLFATPVSSSTIQLNWSDNANNETGVRIEQSSGLGFSPVLTVGMNVTTTNIGGLSASTTYTYQVRTYNAAGYSGYSNQASATTLAAPVNAPAAPTQLSATAVSTSSIALTWLDNAVNENGFRIEQSSGLGFTPVLTVGMNVTTTNIVGLSASTTYTYQVRAYNAAGYSGYSNQASATTLAAPVNVPAAPTQLSATAVSTSSIALTWLDNAVNENGFRIEQSSGLGFSPVLTVGSNITTTTLTGLSASTTYTYQVRAFNTGGYSSYSNQASATTLAAPTSLPNAPAQLVAVTASTTGIDLTWLDKSTNEDGFKIELATGVGSTTFSPIKTTGANVTNTIITGLTPGTSYTFRAHAYNSIGNSGYSNQADAVTRATGAVPAAPSNLIASTLVMTDRLGLDWTDNANNETEFIVESSRDGTVWKSEGSTGAPNIVSVDVIDLLSNTRYCFRVRAHNANGDSYPSNTACATTATATPPAAPTNLTLQTISSTAVLLMWINPTSNTGYKVYESENGGAFALLGTLNQGNLDGTYIYGTLPGNTYAYKAIAFNTYGDSLLSAASNTVTAPAPAGNTVTRFTNNAAYPIVSLQIDGVEQFPSEPQGVPTSAVFEKPLAVGQHTYRAATGFWSYGSRVEMYVYNGTFNQQSGVPGSITFNNPTLGQILTRFGSSGFYVGEYWSGTILNSKGFRFYSNGTCTYYLNGIAQAGACSTSLVSYPGSFIVTFNISYSQGTFQASMDERTGTFYLRNGPSDWPTIQYTYDGH